MTTLVILGISNAVQGTALAAVVFAVTRFVRHAAIVRFLWLLVLLKLVTPPIVDVPLISAPLAFTAQGDNSSNSRAAQMAPSAHREAVPRPANEPPVRDTAINNRAPTSDAQLPIPMTDAASLGDHGNAARGEVERAPTMVGAEPSGRDQRGANPVRRLLLGVGVVWVSGSLLWLASLIYQGLRFGRLLRRSRRASCEIQRQTQQLAVQLGIRRAPEVLVIDANVSPFLWGAPAWSLKRRAAIVLPRMLVDTFSESQRFVILAHELTHLARHDLWTRWLEVAAAGLYWWHPVVWFARRELRHAEELCCDSTAITAFSLSARDYAQLLLDTTCFLDDSTLR